MLMICDHSSPLFSLSAAYYLKGFSFYAQLTSKVKQMNFRGQVIEQPATSYFSAAWSYKGQQIEAFCANMLAPDYSVALSGDYGVYRLDQTTRYDGNRAV